MIMTKQFIIRIMSDKYKKLKIKLKNAHDILSSDKLAGFGQQDQI